MCVGEMKGLINKANSFISVYQADACFEEVNAVWIRGNPDILDVYVACTSTCNNREKHASIHPFYLPCISKEGEYNTLRLLHIVH